MHARPHAIFFRIALCAALLLAMLALQAPAQQAVGPESGLKLPRFISIKTREANLRRGPATSYRIDWTYTRPGLPLVVVAEYDNWRKVRDFEGVTGWMHISQLSGTHTVIVQRDMLSLFRRPDRNSPEVARLEAGVIARLGDCENGWCRLSVEEGYRGWAERSALWGVSAADIAQD